MNYYRDYCGTCKLYQLEDWVLNLQSCECFAVILSWKFVIESYILMYFAVIVCGLWKECHRTFHNGILFCECLDFLHFSKSHNFWKLEKIKPFYKINSKSLCHLKKQLTMTFSSNLLNFQFLMIIFQDNIA